MSISSRFVPPILVVMPPLQISAETNIPLITDTVEPSPSASEVTSAPLTTTTTTPLAIQRRIVKTWIEKTTSQVNLQLTLRQYLLFVIVANLKQSPSNYDFYESFYSAIHDPQTYLPLLLKNAYELDEGSRKLVLMLKQEDLRDKTFSEIYEITNPHLLNPYFTFSGLFETLIALGLSFRQGAEIFGEIQQIFEKGIHIFKNHISIDDIYIGSKKFDSFQKVINFRLNKLINELSKLLKYEPKVVSKEEFEYLTLQISRLSIYYDQTIKTIVDTLRCQHKILIHFKNCSDFDNLAHKIEDCGKDFSNVLKSTLHHLRMIKGVCWTGHFKPSNWTDSIDSLPQLSTFELDQPKKLLKKSAKKESKPAPKAKPSVPAKSKSKELKKSSQVKISTAPILIPNEQKSISLLFSDLRSLLSRHIKSLTECSKSHQGLKRLAEFRSHLDYSCKGLELLSECIKTGNLSQLEWIVSNLMMDMGIQLEQLLTIPYDLKTIRRPRKHSLLLRMDGSGLRQLKPETLQVLKDLDKAMAWGRYMLTSRRDFEEYNLLLPLSLKLIVLCQDAGKDNFDLQQFLEEFCQLQKAQLLALVDIAENITESALSPEKKGVLNELTDRINRLKMDGASVNKPSLGLLKNDSITLKMESLIIMMQEAIQNSPHLKKQRGEELFVLFKEGVSHLIRLKITWQSVLTHPNLKSQALYFRSMMNIRYVFELIYIGRKELRHPGITRMAEASHDLNEFHDFMNDPKELEGVINFSFSKAHHYTRSEKVDGFGTDKITILRRLEKEDKRLNGDDFISPNSKGKGSYNTGTLIQNSKDLLEKALPMLELHIKVLVKELQEAEKRL